MPDTNPITRALLATIAHSTQPMALSDPRLPDHPIIAVNPAFEALTGHAAPDIVGRNCRFLQGPDTDPETPRRIGRHIARQRGCIEWIVNYRRDGTKFWNLLFLSPVFDADGKLLHYLGNQRDITLGPPNGLPDYVLGSADMPMRGQAAFQTLILDVLRDRSETDDGAEQAARALERIVEEARRLNDLTTKLEPAPWTPPASR